MANPARALLDCLRLRLPAAANATVDGTDRAAFVNAFAAATRACGKADLALDANDLGSLAAAGAVVPRALAADTASRLVMLLTAAERLAADDVAALVDDCYRRGDSREREAVLRALAFLPAPERFVALGVDACRTNVVPIFEAIACDNAYPAAHFPELNFNQMALKAVFLGVSVARIAGLASRLGPELARMATDYESERRAAGRTVPADLDRLIPGRIP